MIKRLPISLKIDDEDGDFFYGFIEEKRKNRELTTLILNLLKLYHTNEDVRRAADEFMVSQNPYLKIHDELQRIALEHRKQTTTTGMIGDYTRNEQKKVEPIVNEEQEAPKEDNRGKEILELQERITQLEKLVQNQTVTINNSPVNNFEDISSPINHVENTIGFETNAPVIEVPVTNNQEVNSEVKAEPKKKVPKSFKKMMNSVK